MPGAVLPSNPIDEVRDYLYGTAVTVDLRGLVELRRTEFDSHRASDAPADRFETYGMPYHHNRYRAEHVEMDGATGSVECDEAI